MAEPTSDAVVILRSLDDPAAFGPIFDRHFTEIHRYVARRLGWSLADELAAETFVVAFDRRADFKLAREDARPWLYGIAANLMRRHRRTEARRLRAMARERSSLSEPSDLVEAASERISAQAQRSLLADALGHLRSGDREVLCLAAWAELSAPEIASALGIPIGTVRSRLHRARRQMSEYLAHQQGEGGDSALWSPAEDPS